jgi:hypothetical protein
MCGHHSHQGGRGFRGFGRRGFPSRDVWVERLQAYSEQLEAELRNVKDVIERLAADAGNEPEQPTTV